MEHFQDKWTRWHNKPTKKLIPSSNNGWIYSAYAKYLAPYTYNRELLFKCYRECTESLSPVVVNRSPGLLLPPMSKDEVIGLASLGFLTNNDLKNSYYNFCNLDSGFDRKLTLLNTLIAIKYLFKIRKKHRNYAWQYNVTETYPLLFRLPPWDVYYIKKLYNKKTNILESLLFYLNVFLTIVKGSGSVKMLVWLQLKDLGKEKLAKLINIKKSLKHDFKKDHPFFKFILD